MEDALRESHQVECIRPGDEPPDYYFTIDGVEYSVEMTSLHRVKMKQGRVVSQLGEHITVSRWVQSIEKIATERETLKGKYILTVNGDLSRLMDERKTIEGGILRLLQKTREEEIVERTDLYSGHRLRVRLSKYSSAGAGLSHLNTTGGWAAEIRAAAKGILCQALATKAEKLKDVKRPCILVLTGILLQISRTSENPSPSSVMSSSQRFA